MEWGKTLGNSKVPSDATVLFSYHEGSELIKTVYCKDGKFYIVGDWSYMKPQEITIQDIINIITNTLGAPVDEVYKKLAETGININYEPIELKVTITPILTENLNTEYRITWVVSKEVCTSVLANIYPIAKYISQEEMVVYVSEGNSFSFKNNDSHTEKYKNIILESLENTVKARKKLLEIYNLCKAEERVYML